MQGLEFFDASDERASGSGESGIRGGESHLVVLGGTGVQKPRLQPEEIVLGAKFGVGTVIPFESLRPSFQSSTREHDVPLVHPRVRCSQTVLLPRKWKKEKSCAHTHEPQEDPTQRPRPRNQSSQKKEKGKEESQPQKSAEGLGLPLTSGDPGGP